MPTRNTLCRQFALSAAAVLFVAGFTACDSKNEKKLASQVAARVNSDEISVHQINFVLGRSKMVAISPEQAPLARREILDKLIDQQLAVEQAIDKKLDRLPETLMALEAGRREILARAYIEQIAAGQPKPTAEEARKYIADHPQLFAERRIFNLQEIVVPAASNVTAPLQEMLAAGKSMDDIANWLKSKDIKFAGGSATRPAEQIPLDFLPKLHALKDGQGLVSENAQSVTAMRLVSSQTVPVSEATALPRVQQFLGNQRIAEGVASDLLQLKTKAKISYQGEFAEDRGLSASVKAPPSPPVVVPKLINANLEKGVAGLK